MTRLLVAVVFSLTTAHAAGAAPHATKVRTIEGISEYRLDNGLSVLLIPDPTLSTVTVDLSVRVGFRQEGYGELGMAHLLEHMTFKGAPRHRGVWKLLDSRGAFGNGHTYADRTDYYETLPASQDNVDWALDLHADLMMNAVISEDDLKSEFSVVRNEFEWGESHPEWILAERVAETAYLFHGYGRSVVGSRSDIERVPASALRAFHARYYQPDNATLVVAGKLDVPATLATIERTFGAIAKPTRPLPATYSVEPAQDGERRVKLERAGDGYLVEVAYHAVSGASPDWAATSAAAAVLTAEPSGRLYKKLVETKLAAGVSWELECRHDPVLLELTATVRDGKDVDRVEKILEDELEGLATTPVAAADLARWKLTRQKQMALEMADTASLATALPEWAALGDWRTLFAYRDAVGAVTPADIARIGKAFFVASNRTVGRFVPTAAPIRAPLTEAANATDAVRAIKDGGAIQEGEAFAATLENIDAHTTRAELAGGIKTALLVKKTRHAKVHLELALHWGTEQSLRGKRAAAEAMGAMMMRGTAHKTYQQLQDAQVALEASIAISTDVDGLTLTIDSVRDQLGPALALASEMMTEPAFSAKDFEPMRQGWLADTEELRQNPGRVADSAYNRIVGPRPVGDPLRADSTAERLAAIGKLTAGDVARLYRQIAGASHGELAVVGDFDAAAISAQVDALSKKWPTKGAYARLARKAFAVAAAKTQIALVDKENAVIDIGHDLAMRESDPDYPAMLMVHQVLGGDNGARLWTRVREKEGLSYTVYSWFGAGELDAAADFGVFAQMAPQNLARTEAVVLEELHRLVGAPIDPAELARAKDVWMKHEDTGLSDDAGVAQRLRAQLYAGRTMAFDEQLRKSVQALTVADVERAAKAHVQLDRLVIVEVVDPAKMKAPAP